MRSKDQVEGLEKIGILYLGHEKNSKGPENKDLHYTYRIRDILLRMPARRLGQRSAFSPPVFGDK